MTRQNFLKMTLGLASLTLFTVGCSADDEGPTSRGATTGNEPSAEGGCAGTTISANHGHALTVQRADVEAGVDGRYDIQGSSGHSHALEISAADFAKLRDGESITLRTASSGDHSHTVTIQCA